MRAATAAPYGCECCGRGTAQTRIFRVSRRNERFRGRCWRCLRMPGEVDRSEAELYREVAEANLR